jgi:hypothetical protein
MKRLVAFLFFAISAQAFAADQYYCKLQNIPVVQQALQQALQDVNADPIGVKGDPDQFPIRGMGDAFDYWGWDMLVYRLNDMADDNRLSVGVKVQYAVLMAKEYVNSQRGTDPNTPDIVCGDTGEVNAERVYVEGESFVTRANPVRF